MPTSNQHCYASRRVCPQTSNTTHVCQATSAPQESTHLPTGRQILCSRDTQVALAPCPPRSESFCDASTWPYAASGPALHNAHNSRGKHALRLHSQRCNLALPSGILASLTFSHDLARQNTSTRTHTTKHAATRLLSPLRYQTQLASEPTAIAC